jgi:hypothetical protein
VYPSLEAAMKIFVYGECPAEAPDGSQESPFGTIQEALAAAEEGTTVVVAAGEYTGSLVMTSGVVVAGAGKDKTILKSEGESAAVIFDKVENAKLQGVGVVDPPTTGILVNDSSGVEITGVAVTGAAAKGDKAWPGVWISGGSSGVTIGDEANQCEVSGGKGPGVLVQESVSVIIWTRVAGNAGGGILLKQTTLGEKVVLDHNTIEDNAVVGVGLFSADAMLTGNEINGTVAADGRQEAQDLPADGVFAGSDQDLLGRPLERDSTVDIGDPDDKDSANEISDNQRAGILLSDGAVSVIIWTKVNGNKFAGIWGQSNTKIKEARENEITGNSLLGVVLMSGTQALFESNKISDTSAGLYDDFDSGTKLEFGHGLSILSDSSATVRDNEITGNEIAGIVIDGAMNGAAPTDMADNTVTGSKFGVDVQGASEFEFQAEKNSVTGNTEKDVAKDAGLDVPSKKLGGGASTTTPR